MAETFEEPLDYPVAGQGMTAELGSRPWQNPPQYATVEQALEWYIPRLVSEDLYEGIIDTMELGVPLTTMADTLQTGGVMQGLHTIDVGMLAMPVIIEMLAYMADDAGIEYNLGTEKRIDEDKIPNTKIALALKKARKKLPQALDKREETEPEVEPTDMPLEPSGLMARRM
tara:strand:- start:200 stop:712 length:513 start_codon:yes stop_codon:yes gene_type:complete